MIDDFIERIEDRIDEYRRLYAVIRSRIDDERLVELVFCELARDRRIEAYMPFEKDLRASGLESCRDVVFRGDRHV